MSEGAGAGALPPPLGEADLFGLASAGLLELAMDYVLLGRVGRARVRGATLAATVEGSQDTYTVRVVLQVPERAGDARAPGIQPSCDCPSRRPYCKHVLAVLLLWARDPAAFVRLDASEAALRAWPARDLAALLAEAAMDGADLLGVLCAAGRPADWNSLPVGRCLEDWAAFLGWAREAGAWPQAAFTLGARIAGPPGSEPVDQGVHAAVASRQLAWWLTCAAPLLPAPSVLPWVRHLCVRLERAELQGDVAALPPELAVWLARAAVAMPAARDGERRWLGQFAAGVPALRLVFEGELQRLRWGAEVALRLAVAPAAPEVGGAAVAARCRELLAVLRDCPAPGRVVE